MKKLAVTAAAFSDLANDLPTRVPPSAEQRGMGWRRPSCRGGNWRQLADRRAVGVAELAPGDRHRSGERAGEAAEEDYRRDRDRDPGRIRATAAAQNGDRLRIIDMMIG